jgi:tetratricopeptide (TPR) repeat protein
MWRGTNLQKRYILNRLLVRAMAGGFFAGISLGQIAPAYAATFGSGPSGSSLEIAESLIDARSFIKARVMIERILAQEPNNFRARLDQARLLRSMGLYARSREEYERLHQLEPAAERPLIALSEMALESLNPGQALKLARQSVLVAPQSLETHLCLVSALIAANDYHEAEGVLAELEVRYPNDAKINYLLYKLELKRNQLHLARTSLERSIKLDSSNWQHLFELSEMCKNVGDYEGAKENLKRVLNADPGSVDALTKLAVIYEFNFHDYQQAIEQYQRVLVADPDSVTALAGIDRCKQKSNDLAGVMKDALWRFLRHSKTFPSVLPTAVEGNENS